MPRSLRLTLGGCPSFDGSTTGAFNHCPISPSTEPSTTRIRTQAKSLSWGMLEVTFEVGLDYKLELPVLQRVGQGAHHRMRMASGPVAITAFEEVRFLEGTEDLPDRKRRELVLERGDAQGPQFPVALGDVLPAHPPGVIPLSFEPLHQVTEIGVQILFVFLKRYSVHSGRCLLAQSKEALPKMVLVEPSVESAKPVLGMLRCLVGYGPQGGSPA